MANRSETYMVEFAEMMRCAFSSQATIRNYSAALASFFRFANGRNETDPSVLLRRYILVGLQDKEAKTVNLHRSAVVKFFKLVKKIDIDTNDVPRRKEPRKLPRVLPSNTILLAISRTNNVKHRIVLSLFYGCGLRLSEVALLRRKNISAERDIIWLEDTKGLKHRIVPIPESVRALLYEYVSGMEQENMVFGDITKRTLEKIVSSAFARIGERASPHMLRHSFATDQLASGQALPKIQAWLGHGSIKTTMTYVHLSNALLAESTDLLSTDKYYPNKMGG